MIVNDKDNRIAQIKVNWAISNERSPLWNRLWQKLLNPDTCNSQATEVDFGEKSGGET